ncbi:MAG: hypothetical protein DMF60_13035 [Acidobacteria bacterium]|nr:MAG: hypothetical protein DMF60_13035 [Acidobacteriota bacterium]
MRTSVHFASVPIDQTQRYLLFQTLRGAVDIVPADIALALERADDDLQPASLSAAEVEVLTRRGYLTHQTPEDERQQSYEALQITARKQRAALELVLRFPAFSNSNGESAGGSNRIAEVFSIASEVGGEDAVVLVSLEIDAPRVDGETMNSILEAAAARDYPVLPQVTIAGVNALLPWLRSENFRQVTLTSNGSNMPLDVEPATVAVIACFENQVYVSWKCVTDHMNAEQFEAVQALHERVRLKYPSFMLIPMSEKPGGTSPGSLGPGGRLPVISSENAPVLATLLRFITMPTAINYKPFFSVDPDQIVFDIATESLSYRSGNGDALIEGTEAVRQLATGIAAKKRENSWQAAATASECPACKYALVCGNDWIGKCGHSGIKECAGSFDRRLEEVLPLLLFSLRGNLQRPEATGSNK